MDLAAGLIESSINSLVSLVEFIVKTLIGDVKTFVFENGGLLGMGFNLFLFLGKEFVHSLLFAELTLLFSSRVSNLNELGNTKLEEFHVPELSFSRV